MPAFQQSVPWGGSVAAQFGSPISYVLQQLQQVQQAQYVQQQQLQIVHQLIQILPQQIQQLQALTQFLPQQIAQIVQQAVMQSSLGSAGVQGGFGVSPYGGAFTPQPLQSANFGVPFSPITPGTNVPYPTTQPGYVM
jgi:hypothetical protein